MAVADTVDERSRTDTVPGVSGVWDVDLDSSYGALQLVLDLTQTGSSVTGTVSGSMFQPMAIEAGSVSGDRAQWQASVTEPMAMTLEFQIAFDGDSVTGNVKFGEFGDGTLSGTRRGSADAAAGSAEGVVSLQGRVSETLPPEAISMELLPVVEELGLVENCRQLAAEGWTVIENAADAEFFERLRNTILDTTPGSGSRGRLLDKEPVFAEAALNPSVMAMAEFSVGRGFLMGSLIATVRNAGDPSTPPHSDQDMFPAPFAEHNMMLTACWACDDFTKDGGATLVIPGTKRFRRHPNDAESADLSNAIAIECPAGSVALWDGSVWHGNWPRSIPGQRVVLHATYYRLLMRPGENYSDAADRLVEAWGPSMSQLLGRDDFLYKKNFDYVKDYAIFIRTVNNAKT